MFASLLPNWSPKKINKSARRQVRQAARLGVQPLEDRSLLSVMPIAHPPALVSGPPPEAGGTIATARAIDVLSVSRQSVAETFSSPTDVDMFKVTLRQNDFLAIDVDPDAGVSMSSHLKVFDSGNRKIADVGPSPEPDTGVTSGNPTFGFTAAAPGTYYIQLTQVSKPGPVSPHFVPPAYHLQLQRVSLAEGLPSPSTLEQSGGLYAWLRDGKLYLSGPTGYGFAVGGTWHQTVTTDSHGLKGSTYSASGNIFIDTALGKLPLTLPDGLSFTLTTKGNIWGDVFGEVKTIDWNAQLPLGAYADKFKQVFGVDFSSISLGDKLTVELGSQIKHERPGLTQVLDAVPYITIGGGDAGFSGKFGNVSVESTSQDGLIILADPADPFLYAADGGFAFGASLHGMIPYQPAFAEANNLTEFFGQVYAKGTFPLSGVPLSVTGDVVVDLDANRDGHWLGDVGNADQLFAGKLYDTQAAANKLLADINVGVNGEVDGTFTVEASAGKVVSKGLTLTVPLGAASAVYNGKQQGFWFKGQTLDPFAGTPLDSLQMNNFASVEGTFYRNGKFSIDITDDYKIFGIDLIGSVHADNKQVTVSGRAHALGVDVKLIGSVFASGDFSLTGSASLNFGPFSGSGFFKLRKHNNEESFEASVTGHAAFSSNGWSVGADLNGTLRITRQANGKLKYEGHFAGSGSVKTPLGSKGFSVGVDIVNNKIVFKVPVINETLSIPLPDAA